LKFFDKILRRKYRQSFYDTHCTRKNDFIFITGPTVTTSVQTANTPRKEPQHPGVYNPRNDKNCHTFKCISSFVFDPLA
jgi:hypothetical protein